MEHTRAIDLDNPLSDSAVAGTNHDTASNTEVAVKPWYS